MKNGYVGKMKVASFFSGIGGFDLGLENAGMEVVFQCEINAFCQKVLKKHWPSIPLISDIKNVNADDIPESDLWCGGFPCQDLSVANQGKRKGLNGDRSGLFFKFSELISQRKPRWIVIENVPGILNSHEGEDFRILLETLDEFGYGVSWRVLDAKYFGTSQRRRRVYIVGSLGSLLSSKVLFESEGTQVAPRSGLGKWEANGLQSQRCIGKSESVLYPTCHDWKKLSCRPASKRISKRWRNLHSRFKGSARCYLFDILLLWNARGYRDFHRDGQK